MNRFFIIPKKTAVLLSLATLGVISLTSCATTQPPSAEVKSSSSPAQQASTTESPTLKNLQTAYNGESNAHVMYLAFAKKADEEGYKDAANLFQAAARAEEIHRDNHAKVIREMGATPQNKLTTPEVKSTSENLETAIKGESYERDTMYPDFIKQAEAEGNKDAVQTLSYAQEAEAQHAQLYAQAKNNLDSWRKGTQSFYVCTASGETWTNQSDTAKCPASNSSKQFEKVN
ncbi:MAG: rubrerythrin family protein [Hydrococcus sp. Prado102]|jgi:rubrerythrin|nr:rubrerythrin family protein [Hydrococcus sp. Prado102]